VQDGEEFLIQPNLRSNNWDELQTRKRKIGNEANSAAIKNTSKVLSELPFSVLLHLQMFARKK
jgi:hypothetical protein